MKYLARVWTSALTFGALMLAGSTAASAHRVNGSQQLNNPQNNHQSNTRVFKHHKKSNVYPLYHFRNDQNKFRLGSIVKTNHARRYSMSQRMNNFKMSHHFTKHHYSSYSKANKKNSLVNAPKTDNDNSKAGQFSKSKMAKIAQTKLGDPYVWGATGANAFDCSGFTQYLYKHGKHITIPRTAQEQYNYEKHVSYENIKPGNLVFFGSAPSAISHVGMYIGKGLMIDAQNRGVVIENVKAPWWNLVGCAKVRRY